MRVGIYGGSFNPPHIGHLIIAEWMREEFALDRILWMPAYKSPFKEREELVDPFQRLEMVRCAAQGNPAFDVSDIEVRRGGESFTVETLRILTDRQPEDEFFFLMGSDSLRDFPSWREPEEIVRMANLLVFRRPGESEPPLPEAYRPYVRFAEAPRLEISASGIRNRCRNGQTIRYLVPDAVRVYIESHALYT
ncbi:MAG: nicotinate-nucleotide adenylyltransferase [Bacteroidota bacterium]